MDKVMCEEQYVQVHHNVGECIYNSNTKARRSIELLPLDSVLLSLAVSDKTTSLQINALDLLD